MKKNHGGIIFDSIIPGDFYISNDPGGWTDRTTGIHFPGPTVNLVQDGSRMIDSVNSVPDPVQLPHVKVIVDFKDKDRKVQERKEVPFDRQDETPLHDGISQALGTGIIEHVSDEDIQRFYPNAWKNRQEKYVYDAEVKIARPMTELISEYHTKRALEDKAVIGNAEAALKTPPPPPVGAGKK